MKEAVSQLLLALKNRFFLDLKPYLPFFFLLDSLESLKIIYFREKASVSDFLSGFLSSNSAEITEVTKYTLIFLLIFIYLLGMAYNVPRYLKSSCQAGFGRSAEGTEPDTLC